VSQPYALQPLIRKLVNKVDLLDDEITRAIDAILEGRCSDAAITAFLVALSMKGETAEEIKSIIQSIKKYAVRISPKVNGPLVDTCGTGGDSIRSFNVSTAAAIVASAAGVKVAKHGNRSSSGLCGSADFLEFVGLDLNSSPERVGSCIEDIGLGFLFAPVFHPAMRNVAAARKAAGIRTVFNIVGPLSNPCTNITAQVVGVFEPALMDIMAVVFYSTEIEAMIVHSHDGFDELSNTSENDVIWINKHKGRPMRIRIDPKSVNMEIVRPQDLLVDSKENSIKDTLKVIYGKASREKEDMVVLNASAALVVGKVAADFKDGIECARNAIRDGRSREKLFQLVKYCGNVEKLQAAERVLL